MTTPTREQILAEKRKVFAELAGTGMNYKELCAAMRLGAAQENDIKLMCDMVTLANAPDDEIRSRADDAAYVSEVATKFMEQDRAAMTAAPRRGFLGRLFG